MNAIETIKKDGFIGNVYQDYDIESPRDWDNLGTMTCFNSRHNLGDEHNFKDCKDFLYDLFVDAIGDTDKANRLIKKWEDKYDPENRFYRYCEDYCIEKMFGYIDKFAIILPLYLYDHSGTSISTGVFSCSWDSGQVGWIYVSKKQAKKEMGWKNFSKNALNK